MPTSQPPLTPPEPWRFCPRCGSDLVAQDHGAGERQSCLTDACGFVHWNNPIPVVAAVVELNGRILLARNAAWAEGAWGLITGFLEPVEDPMEGVLREVAEETGLVGRVEKLLGVWPFQRKNELLIAYHVVAEGEVKLSEELVDYRLVEPARLRPWPAGTGHALAEWMRERGHEPVYLERFGEDPGY